MNSPSWKKNLHIQIPPLDLGVLPLHQDLAKAGSQAPRKPVGPPKRCMYGECRVRLGLTAFACRCGGYYCGEHRFDDAHSCGYDYKAEQKMLLSTQLEKVVGKKIDII
jgi:hypothetical protein